MADRSVLGLLEIGQSPQPEMEAEFRHVLADSCAIRTFGALDHLTESEVLAHPPESGPDTLYTTMPDGHSTLVSKKLVTEGLLMRLEDLREANTVMSVLCCSGAFSELENSGVLLASDLLKSILLKQVPKGTKLGLFIPDADQAEEVAEQWQPHGYNLTIVPIAPDASDERITIAAQHMAEQAPDRVFYDCMGYTHAFQAKADQIHGIDSILAIGAVAEYIAEHIGDESVL